MTRGRDRLVATVDRTRAGLAKTGRRNWRGTGNRLPKAAKSNLDEHRGLDTIRDWLARLPYRDYVEEADP